MNRLTLLQALVDAYLPRAGTVTYAADGLTFDPPLTATEQVIFDRLRRMAQADVSITPEEWDLLQPRIVLLRDQRTRSNADWQALTAAQRDSELIEWNRAITDVLRALLRD